MACDERADQKNSLALFCAAIPKISTHTNAMLLLTRKTRDTDLPAGM